MSKKWLIAAFVLRVALAAETSCPVSISEVKRDTGLGDRITYCFSLKATNRAAKPIPTHVLRAAAVDSKGYVHLLNYDYPMNNIPAGDTRDGYFSSHRLLGSDYQGIKIWVKEVDYKDGGDWTDNGDRTCGGQDVKKNLKLR